MNLVVGMTEWLPQWRIILNQLGVPAEKVNLSRPLKTDHYAVIIVSGRGGEKDGNNILNYLDAGGAILTEADVGEWLLHTETVPSFVKYVDPVNDPVFPQAVPGSVDARCSCPATEHSFTVTHRNPWFKP